GGEDAGRGAQRPLVDDQGEVRGTGRLQPGCHPGGAEAARGGDADAGRRLRRRRLLCCAAAHGATPILGRPRPSGRPRARFMLCTAPPAVPLVRLSMALITMIRPVDSSSATCTWTVLAP